MPKTEAATTNVVRQMRKAFFDVSPEGVLVYQDPFIGRLDNPRRGLVVELNPASACLELKVGGRLSGRFYLKEGVADACQRACGAYFEAVASLAGQCPRQASAA